MRTDLDHLPLHKQHELERVRAILFEEFEAIVKRGTSAYKRSGRILKLVLFGSYARGDWVEDFNQRGYRSDYDLLVVVNHDKLTDSEIWDAANERLMTEVLITKRLRTPVNLIVH